MANKKIDMLHLKQLLRLYTQGLSKVKISKQLGLSRNTVKKYISLFHEHRFTYEELSELSSEEIEDLFETTILEPDGKEKILENYFPYVTKELKKTGVTRHILWEEYQEKYPDSYCYSQFCHLYRQWSRKISPSMHMDHKAGDKMFVDYTGKKLHIVDKEADINMNPSVLEKVTKQGFKLSDIDPKLKIKEIALDLAKSISKDRGMSL